jgi:hypothetical protein
MILLQDVPARYRVAMVYWLIGVGFFLVPFPFYFWSLATGRLAAEEEWWSRGMTHGPWRQEWESAFVLIPIYVLLLGALMLAVAAVATAFKWRQPRRLWTLGIVACSYLAFLAIQATTVYWTII